jgi:hypothetical protein
VVIVAVFALPLAAFPSSAAHEDSQSPPAADRHGLTLCGRYFLA